MILHPIDFASITHQYNSLSRGHETGDFEYTNVILTHICVTGISVTPKEIALMWMAIRKGPLGAAEASWWRHQMETFSA